MQENLCLESLKVRLYSLKVRKCNTSGVFSLPLSVYIIHLSVYSTDVVDVVKTYGKCSALDALLSCFFIYKFCSEHPSV
jgi:hypothetical protein